jgi:hypothetical protein
LALPLLWAGTRRLVDVAGVERALGIGPAMQDRRPEFQAI